MNFILPSFSVLSAKILPLLRHHSLSPLASANLCPTSPQSHFVMRSLISIQLLRITYIPPLSPLFPAYAPVWTTHQIDSPATFGTGLFVLLGITPRVTMSLTMYI